MPDTPELSSKKASQLVKDVATVPSIVGALGLAIADAQKAFNVDYLDNVERILGLAKQIVDKVPASPLTAEERVELATLRAKQDRSAEEIAKLAALEAKALRDDRGFITEILSQLAPPRYQYTETTLSVRLDLSKQFKIGGSLGIGAGFGAVAVNASLSMGYGSEYRSAAEVRTVIHAIPNDSIGQSLLARAEGLDDKILELPDGDQYDDALVARTHSLVDKMTGSAS